MLKKYSIILIVVPGILLALTYCQIYVVRGSGGGVLYWNSQEALLFMQENIEGAHMSALWYGSETFLRGWGVVRGRDDLSCESIVVIRVTNKDIQTYDTDLPAYVGDDGCIFRYELFDGQIYAVSWPKMFRWSGTQFERPTAEEYGAYATAMIRQKTASFDPHPWEFDNKDGWSMRQFGATPHETPIVLGGESLTITFRGETWPPAPLSVDLLDSGRSPQTLWTYDGRPRLVSKRHYYNFFKKHDAHDESAGWQSSTAVGARRYGNP